MSAKAKAEEDQLILQLKQEAPEKLFSAEQMQNRRLLSKRQHVSTPKKSQPSQEQLSMRQLSKAQNRAQDILSQAAGLISVEKERGERSSALGEETVARDHKSHSKAAAAQMEKMRELIKKKAQAQAHAAQIQGHHGGKAAAGNKQPSKRADMEKARLASIKARKKLLQGEP